MESVNNKNKIILTIIILIAVFIRFYNFDKRGLMIYDESYYMREAQFFFNITHNLDFIYSALKNKTLSINELKEKIEGLPPLFTPKPLHSLMLGVCTIVIGLKDYLGICYSTFFTVLTLIVLYKLSVLIFKDTCSELLSCWLFTISVYQIVFSRMNYPEVSAQFFYVLALYYFLKQKNFANSINNFKNLKIHLFIGILLAFSVLTNYRNLWILVLFCAIYLYFYKSDFKILAVFFGGWIVLLIGTEIVYQIIKSYKQFPEGSYTYFEMFFKTYNKHLNPALETEVVNKVASFAPHLTMFKFLIWGDGWVYTIIFILSTLIIFFNFLRIDLAKRLIFFIAIFPFILFSISYRGNRIVTFSSSLPLMPLLFIIGIDLLENKFNIKKNLLKIILTILITITVIPQIIKEINFTSGYAEMCNFLKQEKIKYHFTTNIAPSRYYISRTASEKIPLTIDDYQKKAEIYDNIEYFITDLFFYAPKTSIREIYDFLEKNGELVKIIENNWVVDSVTSHDNLMTFFENLDSYFANTQDIKKIKIYKIKKGILREYYNLKNKG